MITFYGILTRLQELWHQYELSRVFDKLKHGDSVRVQSGPFEGMELAPDIDKPTNVSKVVGSYEAELHSVIRGLVISQPCTIVNIGAAEGYYAVGLARLIAGCRVYAFELDTVQQRRLTETARRNGVQDRVVVLGKCDTRALASLDLHDAFFLVDCEGGEIDVLDPSAVPALAHARLLVELHDALRPGCSRILWQRFHNTHEMRFISATVRNPSEYACPTLLRRRHRIVAVEERRLGVQEWTLMVPSKRSCVC